MAAESTGGVLTALSDELAAAVEKASQVVVTVEARRRRGASGILWPAGRGIVVTADHVIEREDDILVTLPDGQKIGAAVAGRDPSTDIAVLRLAGEPALRTAELAAPDALRVGHLVLAIGRPSGAPMASLGIVSALGGAWRTARGGVVQGYIRADVSLFPGFSGGPLVATDGRVAGLNSWHFAHGQEVAIPSHLVSGIVQALLTQGRIRRAYLGVASQPVHLPDALRQALGLPRSTGLLVVGVEAGSPAERGGLLLGDVLIAVGGQPVSDAEDLQAALGTAAVGAPLAVTVVRGGQRRDLTVTPGERA
ncbi:MAG TPA: trypsin-like peptidase domain-containing protein [Isosphaeraceae bacterium]|nr:trypsin-like peptidase domain-containing protein [Isosphaeraceae bacterium]